MIALLRGKVVALENDSIILEVNGVGYYLQLTGTALASIDELGMETTFHTHMQVRDDHIALYGFATLEEQQVFQKIISVSGIGPRIALNILSTFSPAEFIKAIHEADRNQLVKVNGVGKKTAERLILELKDKFEAWISAEEWDDFEQKMPLPLGGITEDALSALLVLGYSNTEAEEMVNQASALIGDQDYDLQAFLKVALSSSRRRGNS